MKKFILILLFVIFLTPVCAFAETDEFDAGYDAFARARNLKPVSEEDVQRVLKTLEERKAQKAMKKKHWWQKDKKPKKQDGAALSKQGNDAKSGEVVEKPYLLIQLTGKILGKNSIIEPGFYTVGFNKSTETLSLKQGYASVGEIQMQKSFSEPEFEELYYIKTKNEKEYVRFLYGEIDRHYEGFGQIVN